MLLIKRLGIDDAHVLIAGARTKAEEIGVPMCLRSLMNPANSSPLNEWMGEK